MGQGMFFLAAPSCRRRGRRLQLPPRDSHWHVFSCVLESRPAVSHGCMLLYFNKSWTRRGLLHLVTVTVDHGHYSLYFDTVWIMSHGCCSLYFDTLGSAVSSTF